MTRTEKIVFALKSAVLFASFGLAQAATRAECLNQCREEFQVNVRNCAELYERGSVDQNTCIMAAMTIHGNCRDACPAE